MSATLADMNTPSLPVLFRDEWFIAIDKPAGMLVHRTGRDRTEQAALQCVRDQIGQRIYPIHRLDRPTSGVLIFGLTPEASGALSERMREHAVDKRYHAVVRGHPPDGDTIDYPLVDEDEGGPARDCVTIYRTLARSHAPWPTRRYAAARYALVEAVPKTGRRHQIRRHLAHLRHPIIGDVRHGDGEQNALLRTHLQCHRLLLFAVELSFIHPMTQQPVRIHAPLRPEDERVLARLGLS